MSCHRGGDEVKMPLQRSSYANSRGNCLNTGLVAEATGAACKLVIP